MNKVADNHRTQHADKGDSLKMHMGIAEQGKLYALQGDHRTALIYYREAIHMAVQGEDPEIFFRHYLECVIESLEQMGSFDEVLAYCDKVLQHYFENPPPNAVAVMDLAHTYQRKGVVLFKIGERDLAREAFQYALEVAAEVGEVTSKTLPLAQTLLKWIQSGWHVDTARILAEQQRTGYFAVRRDMVDSKSAIKLPHEKVLRAQQKL